MAASRGETDTRYGHAEPQKNAGSASPKGSCESRFFAAAESAFRHLEKPLKKPISSIVYEPRLYAGRVPFFMAQIDLDQRPFRAA
jgi:hypothetical protein